MTYVPKEDPSENVNVDGKDEAWRSLLILFAAAAGLMLVVLVTLVFFFESVITRIPADWESRLFAALPFEESSKEVPAWTEGQQILIKLLGADEAAAYKVHVFCGAEANAFALPGRRIWVTEKTLDMVDTENAMAFVLAHEVGHFRNRDHLRGLGRELGWAFGFWMLGISSGSSMGLELGREFLSRSSSREAERSADATALELMTKTYGHLEGAETFLKEVGKKFGAQAWASFLSTHPNPEERVQWIESEQLKIRASQASQNSEAQNKSEPLRTRFVNPCPKPSEG